MMTTEMQGRVVHMCRAKGFKGHGEYEEVKGFEAPAEKAKAFGLTDNQPAKVRVFVLGDAPNSTPHNVANSRHEVLLTFQVKGR